MLAVVLLLAAGCGGSKTTTTAPRLSQQVAGDGFRFTAPPGWPVRRKPRALVVGHAGSAEVSVLVFALGKPYRAPGWKKVAAELDRIAAQFAAREGGRVRSATTRLIAGRRARLYEISVTGSGVTERIAFVFSGRREYQLFCRFRASAVRSGDEACRLLVSSFRLA